MHAAAVSPRGGVAPETTRLRGQSIIEYVLIAAVIGLVVVFAGPQVAGAIRNQFNQLTEMLDDGTSEKAFDDSDKALYLNLDSILFQREKMVNVAMQFYKE